MQKFAKILVAVCLVAAAGYVYHRVFGENDPQVPAIPDVDNGDGTVSYTLVGRYVNFQMKPVAYTSWVLRLPKKLVVRRPSAADISVSGGGASFSTKSNPNSGITFDIKWPSFDDGHWETKPIGSAVPADRSVVSVIIDELSLPSISQAYQDLPQKTACKWKATSIPGVFTPGASPKSEDCFIVGTNPTMLVDGTEFLAVLNCEDSKANKACYYTSYYLGHSVTGTFALELLPQFRDIRAKIIEFIRSATVSLSRTELVKGEKTQ